ncbi:HEAT repeat domain-containing protein [bacterium]|jgi:putative membrane-bound dehydrogenase-like protein|nr:HEAT repeat domain-containing protein [bacterium]MDA7510180.1 HEAT repeat domain-containing protein [Verrucomicrobiota bacterium]
MITRLLAVAIPMVLCINSLLFAQNNSLPEIDQLNLKISMPAFEPPIIEVASGFEIELVAAPPLVGYPMMACFDDRGRLYVAESDGQNLTTKEEYLTQRPRFVRRLEDTDGDGRFDRSTIFADQMTMPEGGLWHDGALYIISAPYLWRLEDIDDDGVADRREKILGYMEFDGRANQHGPYLGPNGRLYFSGGHFGFDFVGSDGSRSGQSRAAGVFSCWPDGSDVRVEGQGPVNPVDVVFTPEGEMLTTCAIFDGVGGRHDALIHWVPGGLTQQVYGDPVLPDTGFRLPAMTRWGQVAPAGFVRYRGTQFGADYRDSYFACQFNAHKLVHVELTRHGASFVSREKDLVWSENRDFHPADVLEDADGSLLLLDTGAWLSWGCPFSELAKPEIKGAIYRIRRSDASSPEDPLGLSLKWDEVGKLIQRLTDARPAIRDRAAETLVKVGKPVAEELIEALTQSENADLRRRVVRILSRIKGEEPKAALRTALVDVDSGVQQLAVRSLGTFKDRSAVPALIELFADAEAPLRRAIASALGKIGDPQAVSTLLESSALEEDHFVRHAQIFALIEIGDTRRVRDGLAADQFPRVQHTALRVLDQMGEDVLEAAEVLPFLSVADSGLRQEAQRIIAGRSEWQPALLKVFEQWVNRKGSGDGKLIESLVLSLMSDKELRSIVGSTLLGPEVEIDVKIQLLQTLSLLTEVPESFVPAITHCLHSETSEIKHGALSVIRRLPNGSFDETLEAIASDEDEHDLTRVIAAELISHASGNLSDNVISFLFQQLAESGALPLRKKGVAKALGNIEIGAANINFIFQLLNIFPNLGPLEFNEVIRPFIRFGSSDQGRRMSSQEQAKIGARLLTQVRASSAWRGIKEEEWQSLFAAYPDDIQRKAKVLSASRVDENADRKRLHDLLSMKGLGNASRGRAAFFAGRGACVTCHRVEGIGGTIGPDLSKIGLIRQPKDLLEAILFPSSTIVNGFETYEIATHSGEIYSGVIQRQTPKVIHIKNAAQQETQVPREQIEALRMSAVSTMPEGLDQTLSDVGLLDIVEFLVFCR